MIRKFIYLLITFFYSTYAAAQCSSGRCSMCQVNAKIASITGGTVGLDSTGINGVISASTIRSSQDTLEVYATSCGDLRISLELDFVWDRGDNNNWIHGISFENSDNWLAAEGIIIPPNAGWIFQDSIVGACSNSKYGAGYYWDAVGEVCNQNKSNFNGTSCPTSTTYCEEDDSYLIDGDPRDNYGLNCTDNCPKFGFDLIYCPIDAGNNTEVLSFTITEDGETGGYRKTDNCNFTLSFPIKIISSGIQIPDLSPVVCKDSCITLDAGLGCDNYLWSTGETTKSIEVCALNDTIYSITVTAATGCEVSSDIEITVIECCNANAGDIIGPDTLFICPLDTPEIMVSGTQNDEGYFNYIYSVRHGVVNQIAIDSTLLFETVIFEHSITNCDTFTIYSVNIQQEDDFPQFISTVEQIQNLSGCHDIDSMVLVLQDDDLPTFDYTAFTEGPLYDASLENTVVYKEQVTLNCIDNLSPFPEINYYDNCEFFAGSANDTLIIAGELESCKLSFTKRIDHKSDYCGNSIFFIQNITLEPDSFYYEVNIESEYCLGENNGSIIITNPSSNGATWSLDQGPFVSDPTFINLSPGAHYLQAIDACDCPHYDTLFVDYGTELTIDIMDVNCSSNGTLGVPEDDIQTVTITVYASYAVGDSCQLNVQGESINIAYGETFTVDINSTNVNEIIEVNDLTKPGCNTSALVEGLEPCSGVCQISVAEVSQICFDNGTRGFPDDDYYEITLIASVENTISDSFEIQTLSGEVIGTYEYETEIAINLSADNLAHEFVIIDQLLTDCSVSFNTIELNSCSGDCEMMASVLSVLCDDNGTRDDPLDDTWSYTVTATIADGSGICALEIEQSFLFFKSGDTIEVGNIPIDLLTMDVTIADSMLLDCNQQLSIAAPLHCSPCIADIDVISYPTNCPQNEDGALDVTITGDTLINITLDGVEYTSGNSILASGEHELIILYGDSCSMEMNVWVESLPLFDLYHSFDYEMEQSQSLDLLLETNLPNDEIDQILWTPSDGLSCDDCLNPTFDLDSSITYEISMIDIYGCYAEHSLSVVVHPLPQVYFPNIISIHSSINECFFPSSNDNDVIIEELLIFDRWGNLIFQNNKFSPNQKDQGWCGNSNQAQLSQGVYIYTCSVTLGDGDMKMFVGDVTLLK